MALAFNLLIVIVYVLYYTTKSIRIVYLVLKPYENVIVCQSDLKLLLLIIHYFVSYILRSTKCCIMDNSSDQHLERTDGI